MRFLYGATFTGSERTNCGSFMRQMTLVHGANYVETTHYFYLPRGKGMGIGPVRDSGRFLNARHVDGLVRGCTVPYVVSLLINTLCGVISRVFVTGTDCLNSCNGTTGAIIFPLAIITLTVTIVVNSNYYTFIDVDLKRGRIPGTGQDINGTIIVYLIDDVILTTLCLVFTSGVLTIFNKAIGTRACRRSRRCFFCVALNIPFCVFKRTVGPVVHTSNGPQFTVVSALTNTILGVVLSPIFVFNLH